jgi:dephospho-CoA kinase
VGAERRDSGPGAAASRPFLVVGLTGGIASGKNLVGRCFEQAGIPVIDADPIGHELIEPGAPSYRQVIELFGREVLAADGRIDRAKLAQRVFADPARRRALNALLHPPILLEAERRARALHEQGGYPIVVMSAALLVEAGAARQMDRVVLVACRPEVQIERLRRRDGLTLEQARARLAAQVGDAERRRMAHFVIDNSGSRAATRARALRVARVLWGAARRRGLGLAGVAAAARALGGRSVSAASPPRGRTMSRRRHGAVRPARRSARHLAKPRSPARRRAGAAGWRVGRQGPRPARAKRITRGRGRTTSRRRRL